MADIELVIKIPEEVEHKVYAYGLSLCPSDKEQLINAIMNGKPLPKGHGRLIDADKLYDDYEINSYDWEDTIEYAPTIIEADKKESEEV